MKWEEWLDHLQVSVTGSQAERVLWDWEKEKGRLSRIRPILGGFTAWLPRRRLPRLEALAQKREAEVKILKAWGPGRFLAPYHARLGLVMGPLCFFALIHWSGTLVWNVQYIDFTPSQRALVEEKLRETGLQAGQTATQEKLRQAEQELMSQNQAFGWVSLNFVDGRLTAECTPAMVEQTFPQSNPWDLIAAVDGVILSQDVSLGFTQTRVGDTVTKGQVLVSCYKLDHNNQPVWQETYGQVVAEFAWEYTYAQPLEITATVEKPGGSYHRELWMGEYRWTLSGEKLEQTAQVDYQPLTLWGLALPATLVNTYYPATSQEQFNLSQEGAARLARYRCLSQLLEEFPDARVLEEEASQQLEQGVLYYTWRVKASANIARPADQPPVIETPVE